MLAGNTHRRQVCAARLGVTLAGRQQRLERDTARVQTGASGLLSRVHYCNFTPQLRGANGRDIAARSRTQHQDIHGGSDISNNHAFLPCSFY